MPEKPTELLDVPTEKMDQLALLNEVIAKRQEEVETLRVQRSNLLHQIEQAKIQWEEQRRSEEYALRTKQMSMDQAHASRLADLDAIAQARQDALDQAELERQAAVGDRVRLAEERRQLGDLNRERVEIERLRAIVVSRQQDVNQQFQESQAALNTANQWLDDATKKLAEVETRTAQLNQLSTQLQATQEELDLRAKHLNIVQETVGQIVEKLPVPEPPPLSTVPTAPPIPPLAPPASIPDLSSPPLTPIASALPPLPPEMDTNQVEIVPQVMPSQSSPTSSLEEPSGDSLQAFPEKPYVHPSQRRVRDGTKPLNEQ